MPIFGRNLLDADDLAGRVPRPARADRRGRPFECIGEPEDARSLAAAVLRDAGVVGDGRVPRPSPTGSAAAVHARASAGRTTSRTTYWPALRALEWRSSVDRRSALDADAAVGVQERAGDAAGRVAGEEHVAAGVVGGRQGDVQRRARPQLVLAARAVAERLAGEAERGGAAQVGAERAARARRR